MSYANEVTSAGQRPEHNIYIGVRWWFGLFCSDSWIDCFADVRLSLSPAMPVA